MLGESLQVSIITKTFFFIIYTQWKNYFHSEIASKLNFTSNYKGTASSKTEIAFSCPIIFVFLAASKNSLFYSLITLITAQAI